MFDENGWKENSKLVLSKLDDLKRDHRDLSKTVNKMSLDIVSLKTRASMWGATAGAIATIIITSFFQFIIGKKS